MHWSLHTISIQLAVEQGLVEKINAANASHYTRQAWLARLRAECIDEEQWLQEYCCIPADESAAFISSALLAACEDPTLKLMTLPQLCLYATGDPQPLQPSDGGRASNINPSIHQSTNPTLFLGMDVARKHNLCVIDVGEKIGDVFWDRLRLELHNQPFSEMKLQLYRLLRLPQLKRACIDATGLGMQLAEEAKTDFPWKVEGLTFTAQLKEKLAFLLRADFEDRKLRLPYDPALRADLRALTKEVTSAGHLRFVPETDDTSCDRTWAKALRQYAARTRPTIGARLG